MSSRRTSLLVEPLDATFGAVVHDVALAEARAEHIDELTELWREYALLVFPAQHLTPHQQNEFARRLGDLEVAATPLTNVLPDGSLRAPDHDLSKSLRGNETWHHDSTFMPVQAAGAVFSAEIVPADGGDTGFADMRAAYEALDNETRLLIGPLAAHHSRSDGMNRAGLHVSEEDGARQGLYGFGLGTPPPLRPLVNTHPATGRQHLTIGQHAHAIPGLAADESAELLDRLNRDACQRPRTYFHRWAVGDAVLWDNRRLMHRATPHDPTQPRRMWHTRLAGDPVTDAGLVR